MIINRIWGKKSGRFLLGMIFLCSSCAAVFAQQKDWSAAEIKLALKKANTLGTVLYVAAHPDDENTRLIAWMANEKNLRTAYLSLTRGDGGQNLIGTEKGELMGLLRTNELLEARAIDRGEQFFTRANDFGYSKNPDETFTKWDKQQVLADVVWTIRKFRPDIMITRFPPTSRAGHGHHTASAILAAEAFDLAADPKAFPEQLKYVQTWQPKRLFFNNSTWWDPDLADKAAESDKYQTVDIGDYNPLLGKSYSEIASESRSMHKSQGFGSGKTRGSRIEFLELIKGNEGGIFGGIDHSWARIEGGKKIGSVLAKALEKFDIEKPFGIVSDLTKAYALVQELKDPYWKEQKSKELQELILACSGVWLEATAKSYSSATKDNIRITASMVARSPINCSVNSVSFNGKDSLTNAKLPTNELVQWDSDIMIPATARTHPYWLDLPFGGMYQVKDQQSIGKPLNDPGLSVDFTVEILGQSFLVRRPLMYKWTDRVKGELYRPFAAMPQATANISEKVYIFSGKKAQKIDVAVRSHTDNVSGKVQVKAPGGWKVNPVFKEFDLKNKRDETVLSFSVYPPAGASVGNLEVMLETEGKTAARSLVEIEYDHIQTQTLLPEAKARVVGLDVVTKGKKIGYVVGAGDEVPVNLEQLGYEVSILDENTLRNEDLSQYDAILTGIRAFNTQEFMRYVNPRLLEYANNGGTYIVQYNTNRGLVTEDIGPWPLKLSRDRVTVEEAEPTFLNPDHPVLNSPNKIEKSDFEGWVQERGLYFPNEWDEKYTPIIQWNDPGEDPTKGSLLVADYGKGAFIYTGISFFRELPAGVPGAYKLIANLISYKK